MQAWQPVCWASSGAFERQCTAAYAKSLSDLAHLRSGLCHTVCRHEKTSADNRRCACTLSACGPPTWGLCSACGRWCGHLAWGRSLLPCEVCTCWWCTHLAWGRAPLQQSLPALRPLPRQWEARRPPPWAAQLVPVPARQPVLGDGTWHGVSLAARQHGDVRLLQLPVKAGSRQQLASAH